MGKVFNILAAAAMLGAATAAFAVEPTHKVSGKIKSIDLMTHVVTLEGGSAYKAARGVNLKRVKAGEMVTLTTSKFGGALEILTITPALD